MKNSFHVFVSLSNCAFDYMQMIMTAFSKTPIHVAETTTVGNAVGNAATLQHLYRASVRSAFSTT